MLSSQKVNGASPGVQFVCETGDGECELLHGRQAQIQTPLRDGLQPVKPIPCTKPVWQKIYQEHNKSAQLPEVRSYEAGVQIFKKYYYDETCPDDSWTVFHHLQWFIDLFGNDHTDANSLSRFATCVLGSPFLPYVIARFTIDGPTYGRLEESPLKQQLKVLLHPFNGCSLFLWNYGLHSSV